MKHLRTQTKLLFLAAVSGLLALAMRLMFYAVATDRKGLLLSGHPLHYLLLILSAGVLLLICIRVRRLTGSNRFADNFAASPAAAAGHAAAALGIFLTALLSQPRMYGLLGALWKVLGLASLPCMLAAGYARLTGRRPGVLMHVVPCLFLAAHIVNHYQAWSGNPQVQDYLFSLLGAIALMFFLFYSAAFDAGAGQRRMHLGMGLAAVYLCLAALARTEYPFLYLGGAVYAATNLCAAVPAAQDASQDGVTQ